MALVQGGTSGWKWTGSTTNEPPAHHNSRAKPPGAHHNRASGSSRYSWPTPQSAPFLHRQRQAPAASSLGGFPTRAEVMHASRRAHRPASKNLHHSRRSTFADAARRRSRKPSFEDSCRKLLAIGSTLEQSRRLQGRQRKKRHRRRGDLLGESGLTAVRHRARKGPGRAA